jgi:hypothetical protein
MNSYAGAILPPLARRAIAERLGLNSPPVPGADADWLRQPAATFVTLTLDGALRGCIGSLEAYRPLIEDLQANAVAAAFHDPRFAPLTAPEFARMHMEVSLLTPMQPLAFHDEADACAALRPGIDGVVLEYGAHKGTFLPQVWEQLPAPARFMAHLKLKAGLPADFWHPELRLFTYQVEKYREAEEHDHGQ